MGYFAVAKTLKKEMKALEGTVVALEPAFDLQKAVYLVNRALSTKLKLNGKVIENDQEMKEEEKME